MFWPGKGRTSIIEVLPFCYFYSEKTNIRFYRRWFPLLFRKRKKRSYVSYGISVDKIYSKKFVRFVTLVVSALILLFFIFFWWPGPLIQISQNLRYHWLIWAILAAMIAWILEGFVLHMFCKVVYPEWRFHYSFCIEGWWGSCIAHYPLFPLTGNLCRYIPCIAWGWIQARQGSIIAMKTLVYQVILVLYSLVMVIWKLPFFRPISVVFLLWLF